GLLLAGGVYTCRIGKTLPVWMLIGGFAVMPWINHRYVFYLAARYIMPLLICALLLIACGFWTMANYVAGRVGTRISNRKPVLIMLMIVIAGLQLVPLYNYCSSLADTNQSNQMALQTAAIVEQANRQKNKLVMVDKDLPLENEPLPILFEIMQQPYKVFKISTASDKSIINNNSTAASPGILILSAKTFALKKEELAGNKIIRLTQRVAFPSRAKDRRNIYIIEMKKKSDQAGKNTV
ncbi:MAG TPA: hypothetical protein VHQ70_02080, partial [Syntrophomonadaceae bacterium]|nr:hypothetical protein [Syntrophomonadaceae bacterium]